MIKCDKNKLLDANGMLSKIQSCFDDVWISWGIFVRSSSSSLDLPFYIESIQEITFIICYINLKKWMDHVLIQVIHDIFQLDLSSLRWVFITHSKFQIIEIPKFLWETKVQRWKWCDVMCVCVCVCVCVCYKIRVVLRKY